MKKNYFILTLLLAVFSLNAQIGTSFDEPTGATGSTRYADPSIANHELMNNVGQPTVMYAPGMGNELGFSSTFSNVRTDNVGLSDTDAIGVYAGPIGTGILSVGFSSSAYVIEDPDGDLTVKFESVDLSGTANPRFQMDLFVNSTGYEISSGANDRIYIALEINGGASPDFVIIDTDGGGRNGGSGGDIDAYTYAGSSLEATTTNIDVDISAYVGSVVNLIVIGNFNSSTEEIVFDNIMFTEGTRLSTLSVDEEEILTNSFDLYPNPSNGNVTIKNPGIELQTVTVTDINGRTLKKYEMNGVRRNTDLNLDLKTGLYFVTLTSTDNASTTKKLIIK